MSGWRWGRRTSADERLPNGKGRVKAFLGLSVQVFREGHSDPVVPGGWSATGKKALAGAETAERGAVLGAPGGAAAERVLSIKPVGAGDPFLQNGLQQGIGSYSSTARRRHLWRQDEINSQAAITSLDGLVAPRGG